MTQHILFTLANHDRKRPRDHLDAIGFVSTKGGNTKVDGLDLGGLDS